MGLGKVLLVLLEDMAFNFFGVINCFPGWFICITINQYFDMRNPPNCFGLMTLQTSV